VIGTFVKSGLQSEGCFLYQKTRPSPAIAIMRRRLDDLAARPLGWLLPRLELRRGATGLLALSILASLSV
jgi:hypothetical protein